ncbi:MAG: lipid IV(A) 3-deoxy-D-manno-octulosonic acid transferase [Gammaproteobacteria bacterium]|nr:lipid IV(A) 3-deoxy-D-manno-octulosonic acid transferase [Gammaproteobacteria bacterium]
MRFFYNLLTFLLLVPYAVFWLIRGVGNRSYFDRLGQRFGLGYPKIERCIWIHAVSVGEVQAALPLIRALRDRFPQEQMLVTTVTPTGSDRVKAVFGDSVHHCYIPFEFPGAVNSFFNAVNPDAALIMETEIWPNLYRACGVRNVPLILVSARISPRSINGYRRMMPLIRETLSHGIIIAAQSQSDADRFLSLGADPDRTRVTGSIKFDIELHEDTIQQGKALRADLIGDRPVWIAASTHDGEEQQVLDAHRALLEQFPRLLLILVPRHPERFSEVRELIESAGLSLVSRTEGIGCSSATSVLLGDTMGEVPLFYAASDVAFVGGSLVPIGGHNLLEPAAQALPIVTGPHLFNAQDIADMFVEMQACVIVNDKDELPLAIADLLANPEKASELGRNGRTLLEQNRGALTRLLVVLEPLLSKKLSAQ